MKKVIIILMVATFVLAMAGVALATDPTEDTPFTFIESPSTGSNPAIPSTGYSNDPFPSGAWKMGASNWRYMDSYDAAPKYEGSYREFDTYAAGGLYTYRTASAVTAEYLGSISATATYPVRFLLAKPPTSGVALWRGTSATDSTAVAGTVAFSVNDATGVVTITGITGTGAGTRYIWASYTGTAGLEGPHGGYTTTSNKCKTCHAVHRANGGFKLMRVDDPNDACSYCHVGSHLHSLRAAYFAGDGTVYPENGHTMGSGKSIPDSTTWQWLEEKTLEGGDDNPIPPEFEATVHIRRYNAAKNKIMMWSTERASYHVTGSAATVPLLRWGPTLLTCMSCHQPHNADKLIWKPDSVNGYKLLRATPSGSIIVPVGASRGGVPFTAAEQRLWMETYSEWSIMYPDAMARAVQDTLSVVNSGMTNDLGSTKWPQTGGGNAGKTIYTQWKATNLAESNANYGAGFVPSDMDVNEVVGTKVVPRLSVWCADCHNLNIGYYEQIGEPNFRGEDTGQYHSDRTHSAGGRIECWNCHSTNLSTQTSNWTSADVSCSKCHYYNNGAVFYTTYNAGNDFPHAGETMSTKLLDDAYDASYEHLDFICKRCHDLVGDTM